MCCCLIFYFFMLTKHWRLITIIIIRKVCSFRKMEKIYMLILVSMDL